LADSEDEKVKRKEDDRLILGYGTVVRERALLTTTVGIVFGFLLNLSINAPKDFSSMDKITLFVALYSITISGSRTACLSLYLSISTGQILRLQ
jgi:hypothetical protein